MDSGAETAKWDNSSGGDNELKQVEQPPSPGPQEGQTAEKTNDTPLARTHTSRSQRIDGGITAWLQVVGGFAIMIATWGLVNTFGVYQTYYQTDLLASHSASSISWIGSLQACLLLLGGIAAGPLFDAGYFTIMLFVGLFMIIFGMFMTSICKEFWQVLLAQGICVGIGMGLTFLPSAAIVGQYFQKRRGAAIGIAAVGSPIGGIIFPIIFSRLLVRIGFGWATRVIAFIVLGVSVVPVLFMRPRLPPPAHIRHVIDKTALTDFPFVAFTIGASLAFLVLYTAYFYIQVFDELNHLSTLEFAPYTVTLMNTGSVFGRLVVTYLGDKLGMVNMSIATTFGSAVLAFGWMGLKNLGGVVVFTLIYGFTSGAVVSVSSVAIMHLSPDLARLGTRLGMSYAFASIFILVGTPIAGAIFGDFSRTRWLGGMGYTGGGLVVAALVMLVAALTKGKEKNSWKV